MILFIVWQFIPNLYTYKINLFINYYSNYYFGSQNLIKIYGGKY